LEIGIWKLEILKRSLFNFYFIQDMKPAKKIKFKKTESGYIALLSVIIIGIIGVSVGVSLVLLGLGSSRDSFALQQSNQAKALANACAEEGLQKIRESTSFTGSGGLSLDSGTCSYTVASQGGSNRTVVVSGTVGTIVRKASITVTQINPTITVSSWLETP
jgi:hypothetical protein